MKMRLATILLILGLLFSAPLVHASHVYGAEVTYSCVNPCTTRVHLRNYRNCTGSFVIGNNITWRGAGCTPPPPLGGWSAQMTTEITALCPGASSGCTMPGSAIGGVEEYYWYRDYDVCAVPTCLFRLVWSDCCRNPGITSLVSPGSTGIYVGATTVNTAMTTCNSSPQFLGSPVVYIMANQHNQSSVACYDPDGDSLSYSLGPCYGDSANYATYQLGYSATTPMGPSWDVQLDPSTGTLDFLPQPGNLVLGIICVYVEEWRNGALIGTMVRDFMYTVISSPGNAPPLLTSVSNVSSNALQVGNDLYLCTPSQVCFEITGADADPAQALELYIDGGPVGATFTEVGNPSVQDTIPGTSGTPPQGLFCWTPPAAGHYTVRFKLKDDACPLFGAAEQAVNIHVGGNTFIASASATLGACPSVSFNSSVCGPGPNTYAWSGAGGLSSTAANPSHNYPGPGSYPWQLIVSSGASTDTILDTVVIPNTPVPQTLLTGNYYVVPCFGVVYDTLDAGGGWGSYLWNTGATTQQLVAATVGTYSVTVTDANGCPFTDDAPVVGQDADIGGYVQTSTGAPLIDQKVYLILYDTLLQGLFAIDSIQTDSAGYYYFCNVNDTIVFVKAAPDSADYPTEMPTYADTSLFWSGAIQMFPITQSPISQDFSTLYGANPGGPGFIGGLIVQGANKVNAPGDPMAGVRIMLRDRNSGAVLGFRESDAGGYFSFADIPLGDYELVPDLYPRSTVNVPQVTLDAQQMAFDSLDLRMHGTWLELVMPTTGVVEAPGLAVQVLPNPFDGEAELRWELSQAATVSWCLRDLRGRTVAQARPSQWAAGRHGMAIGAECAAGCYLLEVTVDGQRHALRVVKTR